eukprot:30949-Pelagococcus_subviridis.AAC.4
MIDVRGARAPGPVVVHLPSVKHEPVRARLLLYEQREVVHPVPVPAQRAVVRHEPRARQHRSEQVAVRRRPAEHPAEIRAAADAVAAERVLFAAAQSQVAIALDDGGGPRVDRRVRGGDLLGGEDVPHDEEAVQVELVALQVGHPRGGGVGRRRRHRRGDSRRRTARRRDGTSGRARGGAAGGGGGGRSAGGARYLGGARSGGETRTRRGHRRGRGARWSDDDTRRRTRTTWKDSHSGRVH